MKKILFVGSFKHASSTGHVGGQMFVCNTIVNSKLNQYFNFILLDSTATTNRQRILIERFIYALKRLFRFIHIIIFRRPDACLIFSGAGLSFIEKGLMIIISHIINTPVAWSPRSGKLMQQLSQSRLFSIYFYLVKHSVDMIICQGNVWKNYFINNQSIDPNKCIVIENFIDTSLYSINPDIHKLNEFPRILFLGWISKNKGVFEILEAAQKIIPDIQNIKFVIAGGGEELDALKNIVKQNNLSANFDFVNWVYGTKKIELIQSCDIFLLPSYSEGMPNALLESLACGLIPIVSNVGAIPDVMEKNIYGFMIEPKSSDEITTAIHSVLKDRERFHELKNRNAESIKKSFGLDQGVENYLRCLENLTAIKN